jgi:hypothetical protein
MKKLWQGEIEIRPEWLGDGPSWEAWLKHLAGLGREDLIDAAKAVGSMRVPMRWPKPGCPLPAVDKSITRRITGEAK